MTDNRTMTSSGQRLKTIPPGSAVGILGGGQLGRMMALAGSSMGYSFVTLDPTENSPCGQVVKSQIVAPYDDIEAASFLAEQSDVVTYEFENVDAEVTSLLEKKSYVPQGSKLLWTTQHRLREKRALEAAGLPIAPYVEVNVLDDLVKGIERIGLPAVLKTTMGGYDGKGQVVIRGMDQVEDAFAQLNNDHPLVLEQFIPFEKEISVIAARNPRGEVSTFPPSENIHRENILHLSIVPARISEETSRQAEEITAKIAERLDVIGLIAVEMFLSRDGQIYVNELAPRPHNSGHYTMDACLTSQFEQHVRAICNLPLGSTKLLSPVVMVNILGEHLEPVIQRVSELPPNMKIHLYGKAEAKPKRKMGHLNVVTDDIEGTLKWIDDTKIWSVGGLQND